MWNVAPAVQYVQYADFCQKRRTYIKTDIFGGLERRLRVDRGACGTGRAVCGVVPKDVCKYVERDLHV